MQYANYLSHYGIKGQKWGVRRFQNADGSLTSAGKSRYVSPDIKTRKQLIGGYNKNISDAKKFHDKAEKANRQGKSEEARMNDKMSRKLSRNAARDARRIAKLDEKAERDARNAIKKQRKHASKNASLLSDDELNARIQRLQKEKQLQNLTSEVVNPGRHKAAQMIDRYGGQMLGIAATGVVTGVGMRYVNSAMDVRLAKEGFKVKGYNADGTPNYGGNNKSDDDD